MTQGVLGLYPSIVRYAAGERRGKVASYQSKHRYGDCEVGMNRVMPVLEHSTTKYNAKVLICICLLLAGGFAGTAKAGINKWTAIGPEGGSINTVVVSPSDPMILYAGTNSAGIFKSTNGGASWQAINSGLPSRFISAIAIDPVNPEILYASVVIDAAGVFKSTNGGASWVNTGLSGPITTLVIDPQDPLTLYAGGYGGVFKITNGGASWQTMDGLLGLSISDLAIDPINPMTVYAIATRYFFMSKDVGLFKSTDGGTNWQAINSGLDEFTVSTIVIDPVNPTTLYAGTDSEGVFKSTNGGASWQAINSG
ncbi:hypothetical protein, partial [Candidatus Methylobacter favarea]|uniref:WD40/YVTN/BNR-like repeat-containing protein n=1 Tax=Candidatus Methylobacter favarea TaxID=2707345 RepID=UPI0031B58539